MATERSVFQPTVGQTDRYARFVSDADVALFALVTGDEHPLHLDMDYATTTQFEQRIIPVGLLNGLIEAACAKTIPGYRGIFHRQTVEFPVPAFVDDEITVIITVTQVHLDMSHITCHIAVQRSDGIDVACGDAEFLLVDLPPLPEDDPSLAGE
ncbi:MAG TPA: MaoC/PaaZ C-terminal domain-containing protein [Ktedonobacterales bacterium]|nr:MaoC/PaaZ C-terminal domain-containing protein [Ktedonobacterales bacterium]